MKTGVVSGGHTRDTGGTFASHLGDVDPVHLPHLSRACGQMCVGHPADSYRVSLPLALLVEKRVYMDLKQGTPGGKERGYSSSSSAFKEGVIATLSEGYTLVDPVGIVEATDQTPGLLALLLAAPAHLADYFPGQACSLTPMGSILALPPDEEGGGSEQISPLLLHVHTPWDATRFWREERRFSYEWWLSHWLRKVCLIPCFRPLEEYLRYDARGKEIVRQHGSGGSSTPTQKEEEEEGEPPDE